MEKAAVWEQRRMENGLLVTVVPRYDMPLVSVNVSYRVGSGMESEGEYGVSHFLEHMMFKGSKAYPQGSIDSFSLRSGGENNAFTTRDFTSYYHLLPATYWSDSLKMEADRLYNLRLDSQAFESEKQVVLEELNMYEDDPFEVLYDWHHSQAYEEGHPYHHPIIGYESSLIPMTLKDMEDYYHRYYHPACCEVLLIGDVETTAVFDELSGWQKSPHSQGKPRLPAENSRPGARVKAFGMDIEQTRIMLSFPAFRTLEGKDPHGNLLEELLCGGRTSYLQESLVEEKELFSGIEAFADSNDHGGLFFLSMELREGVKAEIALRELYDLLERLRSEELDESRLKKAKKRVLYCHYSDHERLEDMSYQLVQWSFGQGYKAYFDDFPLLVEKIEAKELHDFALELLDPGQMILGIAYPEEEETPKIPHWSEL